MIEKKRSYNKKKKKKKKKKLKIGNHRTQNFGLIAITKSLIENMCLLFK